MRTTIIIMKRADTGYPQLWSGPPLGLELELGGSQNNGRK